MLWAYAILHGTIFTWLLFQYVLFDTKWIDSLNPLLLLSVDGIYTMMDQLWPSLILKLNRVLGYLNQRGIEPKPIFEIDQDPYFKRLTTYFFLFNLRLWLILFFWGAEHITGTILFFSTLPWVQQKIRQLPVYQKIEAKFYKFGAKQYKRGLSFILAKFLDHLFYKLVSIHAKISRKEASKILTRLTKGGLSNILKNVALTFLIHKIDKSGWANLHNLINRIYPILGLNKFIDPAMNINKVIYNIQQTIHNRDFDFFSDPYNLKQLIDIYMEINGDGLFDSLIKELGIWTGRFFALWSSSIFDNWYLTLFIAFFMLPLGKKYFIWSFFGVLIGFISLCLTNNWILMAFISETIPLINSRGARVLGEEIKRRITQLGSVFLRNALIFFVGFLLAGLFCFFKEIMPLSFISVCLIGMAIQETDLINYEKMFNSNWQQRIKEWPYFSIYHGQKSTAFYLISFICLENSNFSWSHAFWFWLIQTLIFLVWLHIVSPKQEIAEDYQIIQNYNLVQLNKINYEQQNQEEFYEDTDLGDFIISDYSPSQQPIEEEKEKNPYPIFYSSDSE